MIRGIDGVHCCWEGQGWSSTQNKCVGIPVCPADTMISADGTDCRSASDVVAMGSCAEQVTTYTRRYRALNAVGLGLLFPSSVVTAIGAGFLAFDEPVGLPWLLSGSVGTGLSLIPLLAQKKLSVPSQECLQAMEPALSPVLRARL
jgi:hypothetical protein